MTDIFGKKTFKDIVFELQVLNPQALIKVHPYFGQDGREVIQTNVAINKLVLPKGFYCNGNSISNKHNTKSGVYLSITVEPLNLHELNQTMNSSTPKMGIIDKIKQKIFPQNDREM